MSPASVFSAGKIGLITGGANGVGLAVAQLCCKHQMKVGIVDSNTSYLSNAKELLPEVETFEMDVTKPAEWAALKTKLVAQLGGVPDLLMLNAGIGLKGDWGDTEYFHKVRPSIFEGRHKKLTRLDI